MREDFPHCKMEYAKDKQGKEVLLKDGKFQVMMEWEKPYMIACIDALKPFGDVLEVGFGLGFSANHIQTYHPKSHTIIEYHPVVAARAREWAKQHPHVKIVEDTWQHALARLGIFDCIFFDDYPLHSEQEMQQMQKESDSSRMLLEKGKKMIQEVEKKIPFLTEIKYSDDDLKGLLREAPLKEKEQVVQFVRFLNELAARGQITEMQLKKMQKQLIDEKKITAEEIEKKTANTSPFAFSGPNDRLFDFLSHCLKSHMREGSRFSCFLSSPTSKFEDPKFFNEIILNPFLEFHEEEIKVEVPDDCTYYSSNKALVITIEKKG